MTGHLEHLKFCSQKISAGRFFNEEVRLRRFYLQFKAEASEKVPIRNHWRRRAVTTDLAIEAAFDFGDVLDVVDVTMSEEQQL